MTEGGREDILQANDHFHCSQRTIVWSFCCKFAQICGGGMEDERSIFCRQMTTFIVAKGPLFVHFAANVVLLLHLETGHLAAKWVFCCKNGHLASSLGIWLQNWPLCCSMYI